MLFKKKKVNVIGLDIGSRTLKLAEVDSVKDNYTLKTFGMSDIPHGLIEEGTIKSPDEVANAIRQLFKMHKIKDKHVAVSIGGYSIIVKTISVQSMPPEQLQETIHFEAEQYIPFDISDVNLDFQILGEDEENPNQMNVLLVAAKKDVITEYDTLIRMADLIPRVIDVDAFALQNIYEANYETDGENVALIDIGAAKTTINIVRDTISVLVRDISFGAAQIAQQIASKTGTSMEDAEESFHGSGDGQIADKAVVDVVNSVVAEWCTEIRRALDFFYSTYAGEHIRRIILSGGGSKIQAFRDMLAEETSSHVERIQPFERLNPGGGFDDTYLERVAPQAAICLGLALRRVGDK